MIAPNPEGARHDQSGRHPDVFLHELFLRRPCTRDHNAAGLMIMKGQAVFDLMSQSRAAGSVSTDYRGLRSLCGAGCFPSLVGASPLTFPWSVAGLTTGEMKCNGQAAEIGLQVNLGRKSTA